MRGGAVPALPWRGSCKDTIGLHPAASVGRIRSRNPSRAGVLPTETVSEGARTAGARRRALIAAAVGACLLAALAALAYTDRASSAARAIVLVMGRTASTPPPDCPDSPCLVEGRVTGFQSLTTDTARPFQAPYDGKVISWSITLSRPKGTDRAFFSELFGKPSQARIAVLRRLSRNPPLFKLVRQSPLQVLNPYFGQTVHFALDHPLTVLENQVVALTIPTWAPAFASNLASQETWRASRRRSRCTFPPNLTPEQLQERVNQSHPQQRRKSKRRYDCYYSTNRLLYTATMVKKPRRPTQN